MAEVDKVMLYRMLFDQAPNGILLIDLETGMVLESNDVAHRQLGYTRGEFAVMSVSDYDVGGSHGDKTAHLQDILREGRTHFDTLFRNRSGEIRNVRVWVKAIKVGERNFAYCIFQDITQNIQAEERYSNILKTAIDGFWTTDMRGRLLEVNDAYCRMSGYSRDELLGMNISDLEAEENPEETLRHIKTVMAQGYDRFESRHRRRDGSVTDVEISTQYSNERGGILTVFIHDITERKFALEALRTSLREKETLLREIHHRVKNNLQIISSLLYFQAKKVTDPDGRAALQEGQDRLKSMILVHEKLYRSQDLTLIDFGDYIRSLTDHMLQSYSEARNRISVSVEAGELHLPIVIALPCGMIINELLMNAFKYAFPSGQSGTVLLRVVTEKDHFSITVEDSGAGLSPDIDVERPLTFGMQLIRNLTDQIGGNVMFKADTGTTVTIMVPFETKDQEE